ncbi:MAG: FadR family transcriptional regulator [bacterium]|nr:FadR family transcriptional regulator [bacterium]
MTKYIRHGREHFATCHFVNAENIFKVKGEQMAKRQTVSELVQNYIRDYIVNNTLGSGDQLPPEGEIAAALEVSRTSVREAVKILQTLGIVEVRHGNGLFVRNLNFDALLEILSYRVFFDQSSLEELLQVRKLFEVGMLKDVIENIQEEHIQACHKHLEDWEEISQRGFLAAIRPTFPCYSIDIHINNYTALSVAPFDDVRTVRLTQAAPSSLV